MSTRTLLIADDEPSVLAMLQVVFELDGWSVVTAPDGAKASAILQADSHRVIDVAVLDVMMPELSGLEVLDAIRADDELFDLPVVMLTACATRENVRLGFDRGCDAYLTKPVDPERLLATVAEVYELAPTLRASRRQAYTTNAA